jgi:transcription initiation factor TFIIB
VDQDNEEYEIEISVGNFDDIEEPAVFTVEKEIYRQTKLLNFDEQMVLEVQSLYDTIQSRGLTKYKQNEKIITAVMYIICRRDSTPYTLHKICDKLKVDYRSINKVYRYLIKRMDIIIPPTSPKDYISKFGEELKMDSSLIQKAYEILDDVRDTGCISGKGPAGVAAASLCLACDIEHNSRDPKEVAEVSGVTQVTIRNRYRELEQSLGLLEA